MRRSLGMHELHPVNMISQRFERASASSSSCSVGLVVSIHVCNYVTTLCVHTYFVVFKHHCMTLSKIITIATDNVDMEKFHIIYYLLVLFSISSANDVLLFKGIPVRSNEETLICVARGDYIIWRSNSNPIAIINSQKTVGYFTATHYNSTTVEFNATLLSLSSDSSSGTVRTSSIILNTNVYGGSEIQCQSDLGSASVSLLEESTTTDPVTETTTNTESTTDVVTPSTDSECTELDLLQSLRTNEFQKPCDQSNHEQFALDVLMYIQQYAARSPTVKQALQDLNSQLSTESVNAQFVSSSNSMHSISSCCITLFTIVLLAFFH